MNDVNELPRNRDVAPTSVPGLLLPDNVVKRALRNVYFIWGDGVAVADELGRRHGLFVYHTCEHRQEHFRNADPRFQPGLCRFVDNMPDFFAQDPEEAMRREREIVQDFTPMVIVDLIRLSVTHEKVICENAMDVDGIIRMVTHAVMISNHGTWDDFCGRYEQDIRRRDVSVEEKERLIRKVHTVWGKGNPENPRETNPYGVKQLFLDEHSTVVKTADEIADYFGWPRTH